MNPDIVMDEAGLRDAVSFFLTQPAFAFDTETVPGAPGESTRAVPHRNRVTWLSMATRGACVVIPMGTMPGDTYTTKKVPTQYQSGEKVGQYYNRAVKEYESAPPHLSQGAAFGLLEPLFLNPSITKVAHNAPYDLASTAKYWGQIAPGPYDDTIVLEWLLDENKLRYGLKYIVKEYYHHDYDQEGVGKEVERYPFSKVAKYAFLDAWYCWLRYQKLLPLIKEQGLEDVHAVETALIPVLTQMRLNGAAVDEEVLKILEGSLGTLVEELKGKVYIAAGHNFNLNSVFDKRTVLFDEQKLVPWKKTKEGAYSVDNDVLESFAGNPVADALQEYQETSKILSTYVLGYLGEKTNPKKPCRIIDGRIHTDFVQYGTKTGRFSCREPNLQNIPRPDKELGQKIRGIFIASPGEKLIVADYSQIELRVLAHFLNKGGLYDGFYRDEDPHYTTASILFGKSISEVTKKERTLAKNVNFAIVYGAAAKKVAAMSEVTLQFAKEVLATHRKEFPETYQFQDYVMGWARDHPPVPYIETLLGRKRRVPGLYSREDKLRARAERQAFNSLIQGSAADLQKMAMIRTHATLMPGSKMLLTVHDELVLSSPAQDAEKVRDLLVEAMTGKELQDMIGVPLKVDTHICDRWSEGK